MWDFLHSFLILHETRLWWAFFFAVLHSNQWDQQSMWAFHPTLSGRMHENFGAKSRYLGHVQVIASHRILWDAITYTCPRYLHLGPKSQYLMQAIYTMLHYKTIYSIWWTRGHLKNNYKPLQLRGEILRACKHFWNSPQDFGPNMQYEMDE